MIDGTPKFSSLVVAEITADFKGGGQALTGKAAFVDRTSGATHAWTRGEGAVWSHETVARLHALRESMETDLAALHFNGFAPSSQQSPARTSAEPGGLMEHLSEADQV